jgi:hypothetical protein
MDAMSDWQVAGQSEMYPRAPSSTAASRGMLVLRVLLLVGFVLGAVQLAARPVQKSVGELEAALTSGQVRTLTIERPPNGVQVGGDFRVEWTGAGRPGYASYQYSSGASGTVADEGAIILAAAQSSPSPVAVEVRHESLVPSGVIWGWFGIAVLTTIGLLIAGPQPRRATKWAWFWLAVSITPLWLVFLVLEPVPMWSDQPRPVARRRLTGGWAFLLSLVLGSVVAAAWPDWKDLLTH